MATTGRPAAERQDADALARTVNEGDFVHLVSHADGDSIAAAGLLVRALPSDTGYQLSIAHTRAAIDRRVETSAGATIVVGAGGDEADAVLDAESNALVAFDAATTIGDADPILAIAGAIAADAIPRGAALSAATEAGVERRPGIGIPTADLADGLAHTCLLHAGFSGDEGQAGAVLADLDLPATLDDDARQDVASAVALDATAPPAPSHAAAALERPLRPHVLPDGPFETAEGFADVLESLARSDPGLATALAIDRFDRTAVLEAWRTHASSVHDALRLADRSRHAGFVVLEIADADVRTVARLARDFRSAEPTVLVVGEGTVGLATTERDAAAVLGSLVDHQVVGGRTRLASAETDAGVESLTTSLEEVIR
ncbi:MAG: hypothetical protein ABEJ76_04455 [Halanaeroarchaeum sp.]